jgi:hypothetical protein
MAYSAGMRRHRVEILKPKGASGQFGANSGKMTFEHVGTVWAAVNFQRGVKAVREAAVDGTDYILVRMLYNNIVTRDSYLRDNGVTYMITEYHADYRENIIQIKAQEVNV